MSYDYFPSKHTLCFSGTEIVSIHADIDSHTDTFVDGYSFVILKCTGLIYNGDTYPKSNKPRYA